MARNLPDESAAALETARAILGAAVGAREALVLCKLLPSADAQMPPPENGVDGPAPAPATTALQQTTDAAAARLLAALCRASTVAAASRPKTTPASLLTAPPKRAIKGLEADEQRVSLALQLLATTLSGRRWLGRLYAGRPALLWEFETSTGGRMIDAAVNLARDCVRINASACRILDALRRYHAALQRPLAAPPTAPAPAVAAVAAAPTVTLVPAPAARAAPAPAADGAVPMEVEAPPAAAADAPRPTRRWTPPRRRSPRTPRLWRPARAARRRCRRRSRRPTRRRVLGCR